MSVDVADPRVRSPLVRAALYDALAMAFAYPSDESLLRLRQTVTLIWEEAGDALGDAGTLVLELGEASWASDATGFAGEHSRLFAGEVLCSPYETEYETDPFAKARQLADIVGFYRAWGVDLSEERRTMADFIATEVEYLGVLCRKEANAVANGWDDRVSLASEAETAFLGAHLGRWFEIFADQVEIAARPGTGDVYRAAARLLRAVVNTDLHARGLDPTRLTRRMVSDGALPQCDPKVVGAIPKED